ncbi:ferredoxin--NADP reductase [Thermophagus sp. OGC60D27]|uniref:ferredoxin--NADP reductase n=1 Tax=Thermophagus sp. OGC60D27 TaxID=3458415 RepID=UPI004037C497
MLQVIDTEQSYHKVWSLRWLTDETFSLKMPARGFRFRAGQHITLAIPGDTQSREYSIYSGENDQYLEVLVKVVKEGYFSRRLSRLKPGDPLEVDGPFGEFVIDPAKADHCPHLLIASGTGIAPYRSMVRTYPNLNYRIIHGVRYGNEAYDKEAYHPDRYTLCTSGDETGAVHGRLTKHLKKLDFEPNTQFYLCGNSNMIFDALDILKEKGFSREQIHCEVYF